jgi:hypothetical protein
MQKPATAHVHQRTHSGALSAGFSDRSSIGSCGLPGYQAIAIIIARDQGDLFHPPMTSRPGFISVLLRRTLSAAARPTGLLVDPQSKALAQQLSEFPVPLPRKLADGLAGGLET